MHLLCLRNQGVPSKRVRILATYEGANAPEWCASNAQAMTVSGTPRQLFEESGNQLAMVH
jgi:hypothetical protein